MLSIILSKLINKLLNGFIQQRCNSLQTPLLIFSTPPGDGYRLFSRLQSPDNLNIRFWALQHLFEH